MSNARLTWQLARRFRAKQQRSGFLSFISASSTVGIALGCAAFILGLSVMNGFEKVLEQRFLQLIPQIELRAVQGSLQYPDALTQAALAQPLVTAVRPVVRSQVMLQQGTQFHALQLNGIDLSQPQPLATYTSSEVWQALQQQPQGLLLGQGLLQQLGLQVGQKVSLLVAASASDRQPQRMTLTLVGSFAFGGTPDYQMAYTSLATAQQLVALEHGPSALEISVSDIFAAPGVAAQIAHQSLDYLYIDHWMRSHGHLYRDIQLVRLIMYLVLILVLAVASFNIVSTLVMTVQEKRHHIGILRTMGLRRRAVMQVFIWQGLQNGLLGVVLGVSLGVLGSLALPQLLATLQQWWGSTVLAAGVYFVDSIPAQLAWQDVAVVAAVALLLSVLATLYPAWQAARMAIVDALD